MNDSIEPRNRKYVEGHGFLLFVKSAAIRFGNKYAKKMMDTATKAGMDAAKTASKRVAQKNSKNNRWFD